MSALLHPEFPHRWSAEVLDRPPLIAPVRQFVYPQQVEEVERGALQLLVRPATGAPFLATCARGFADPSVPHGLWSCPHPDWLCAASGGYVYLIHTLQPEEWQMVPWRPVLEVRSLPDHQLLLFVGHHAIFAWGREGRAWESQRLSWEGVQITEITGETLHGLGWDLMTDKDLPFALDLRTGEHRSSAP